MIIEELVQNIHKNIQEQKNCNITCLFYFKTDDYGQEINEYTMTAKNKPAFVYIMLTNNTIVL